METAFVNSDFFADNICLLAAGKIRLVVVTIVTVILFKNSANQSGVAFGDRISGSPTSQGFMWRVKPHTFGRIMKDLPEFDVGKPDILVIRPTTGDEVSQNRGLGRDHFGPSFLC